MEEHCAWIVQNKKDKSFNKKLDKAMDRIYRYKIIDADAAIEVLKDCEVNAFTANELKELNFSDKSHSYIKIPVHS
jgi:hypothetical protein